ncbi:hypothetical protein [Glycomyces sp. NPDC047010]|uniref:hypothetical protein n=1 Tax=Glycomyces sp. NPDC047010 TaxID=3155023 RepID=UPI0034097A3E
MKMNADAAPAPSPVLVSLRRIGTTAGFSFGFVLLGLVAATEANASEDTEDGLLGGVAGALGAAVAPVEELSEVTEPVGDLVAPVAETAEPVVEGVAEPLVAEVVEPVAEPVLEPVATAVAPVLESVSVLAEPITAPVLGAASPVVDPVVEATGLEPSAPLPEEAAPVPVGPSGAPPEPAAAVQRHVEEQSVLLDTAIDARSATGNETRSDPAQGHWPTGGFAIGTFAPVGGASNANGSTSADHATAVEWPAATGDTAAGPGPPGQEPFSEWFGYGDRDHPG